MVVRRAVQLPDLQEHQYIAVRHSDQEHEHVHVAVNKIHPKTLKIHHPWRDVEAFKASGERARGGARASPGRPSSVRRIDSDRSRAATSRREGYRVFLAGRGVASARRST